jgi:hypothetical protein
MGRRLLVVGLALLSLVAGCSDAGTTPALRPHWQRVTLPMPPGPPGRISVRDATSCLGRWYLAGAILGAGDASRPAVWTSDDARTWRSVPLDPHDPWAKRAIMYAIACRGDRVAALGAHAGGAHGNPRTSSWYQRADGTLVDLRAPFELYGGPHAISVDRIAAGPRGWLIAGNRTTGAAVWTSPDATGFLLHDDDPALASDEVNQTAALDAVAYHGGWAVVGRDQITGRLAAVPMAWVLRGRQWTIQDIDPGTDGFAELDRVLFAGDDLVAAGPRGERFGLWRRHGGHWSPAGAFGRIDRHSGRPAYVSGLATAAGDLLVTLTDGARFGLWTDRGGRWREVGVPSRPASSGETQMTVTAEGRTALLLTDDGRLGRAWVAGWPPARAD